MARCVTRSSRTFGRIYELARGLDVGTVIVAVVLGVLAAAYLSDPNFCVWLSCEEL
jgi:hypothetical protein